MAIHRFALRASAVVAAVAATLTGALAHDESKYPDWSGQWRRPPGVGVQWDETKPIGLGQEAPLIPEYRAKLEASIKDQLGGRPGPRQPHHLHDQRHAADHDVHPAGGIHRAAERHLYPL